MRLFKELAAEARSSPGALVTELVTVLGDFASTRTAGTTAAVRSQGVACVVVNISESYDLGEALSQAGVPYVICWTTKVNAYASVLFAKEFYHFCRVFPQDYRKSYAHAVERLWLSNVVFGNPADPSIVRAARRHEGNPSVLVAGIPQLLDRQERAASLQERWMRRMYHMQCSVVVNELKVPNCFLVLPYRAWKEMDTASTAAAASASSASTQTAAQQTPKRRPVVPCVACTEGDGGGGVDHCVCVSSGRSTRGLRRRSTGFTVYRASPVGAEGVFDVADGAREVSVGVWTVDVVGEGGAVEGGRDRCRRRVSAGGDGRVARCDGAVRRF